MDLDLDLEKMPDVVAMRLTEDPCRCESCRLRGIVGWLHPPEQPHHYLWLCGKHALDRIRRGNFWITQKQKAAFRQPSGNPNATKQNGYLVS